MKQITLTVVFMLSLFTILTVDASAISFNGSEYIVIEYAYHDWVSAQSHLLTTYGNDYHLATITSQEENDFIASIIGNAGSYWIGGYQNLAVDGEVWDWVNSEGTFWDNGAVSGMFSYWNEGEPNDANTEDHCGFSR